MGLTLIRKSDSRPKRKPRVALVLAGVAPDLRPERLHQLTVSARQRFPEMGIARPRSEWCGLRPMSVDGLPIVGSVGGIEGLSVATGHGMLGITLGPITGRLVAEEVLDRVPAPPELSPGRFD